MKQTHWRKFHETDYIGAYSLQDAGVTEIQATILSVKAEPVKGADDKSEDCIVAKLKDNKPMILNVTNCKAISKVSGSPFIEEWSGLNITIFIAKVKAFGEVMDALRIKPTAPALTKLPELKPNTDKWDKALAAMVTGTVTIKAIKTKYSLSKKNELALFESAQKQTK